MTKLFVLKNNNEELNDLTFPEFAEKRVCVVESGKKTLAFPELTTTKLRNIYGLIMNLYTKIGDAEDFEKHKKDIQYLKVKMAYEAGREPVVKKFLTQTYLMAGIDYIKTFEQFLLYCRYAESLVAYFKFYGGK